MFQRNLFNIIQKDLQTVPVVVLYGPRQVGKTTIVKQLVTNNKNQFIYIDVELPSDRAKLADPELFLSSLEHKTVILDEVQFLPQLFPSLRSLVDRNRRPGRFLLLGSASPTIMQHSAESLAGRVRYRELFPFSLSEVEDGNQQELWFKGGFPEAFLSATEEDAIHWYADFIHSYATRDLALMGLPMASLQIQRLLQMVAHNHGQVVNYSTLARSLGVSQPTITNALYYLEEAMLIRTLKPWNNNARKRLIKSPKIYIRDTGMLHSLLGLGDYTQLLGHPQAGNSWEGFVIQQIIANLPKQIQPFYYRTGAGAELDLLLVKGNEVAVAIEIKLSSAPQLTRGNTESLNDVKARHGAVVSPIPGSYPLKDKLVVYGVQEFLNELNILL